jgi:hypothetical protein
MAEMVNAPAWMPAHNQASMPSCGGREGIDGSGVSCHLEANFTFCLDESEPYHHYSNSVLESTRLKRRNSTTLTN